MTIHRIKLGMVRGKNLLIITCNSTSLKKTIQINQKSITFPVIE